MNRKPARALLAAAVATAASFLATPALAQGLSIPPRQDARSPTGVSYGSGSFTYEARDLAIGGEQGLTLDRTYISNIDYGSLGGLGWTHNLSGRISLQPVALDPGSPLLDPHRTPYIYNVTVGGRSAGFIGGSHFPPTTGNPEGTYEPITPSGASLVYTGTDSTNGHYIFTDSDGSVINFVAGGQPQRIQDQILPDGTRLEYGYGPTGGMRVISNRGYAILIEPGTAQGPWTACAVNLTQHVVTATSACPAGVQSVAYSYALSPSGYLSLLAGATDAHGQTTTYAYEGAGDHTGLPRLTCITLPGQSTCQIDNDYSGCSEFEPTHNRWEARGAYVVAQHSATGETYAYAYGFTDPAKCVGIFSNDTVMTVNGNAVTRLYPVGDVPDTIVDPLNRTTHFRYMTGASWAAEPGQLVGVTYPLGNAIDALNDARGNIVQQVLAPIPNSGPGPLTTNAVFPSSCGPTNRRICNKPTSVTDANGNMTEYTYDAAHGGVLTETGPAPAAGGIRPQTRHEYAQRYAWILASGGGYVQAATPVWVRTATSTCRTSAATGNPASPCATAGDEVRTAYDYGPNSGPNTLLLRGQAVTSADPGAGGVVTTTLRSCYGYDRDGRRISETQPNANLASCPAGPPAAAMPFTSSTRYDAAGRVTGTISADPDGPGGPLPFLAVSNSYDGAGRLTRVETGTLSAWQSESVAPAAWNGFDVKRTAESVYDSMGRKLRDTLRDGATGPVRSVTQYSYDAFGRLECTAVRMNPADFAAPPASACTQGTGGGDRIARNFYDAAGQRLQLRVGVGAGTGVEGTQATWGYNLNGQVTAVIDGNGNRAELHYDGHGRQDRWTFPSTTRATSFNDATPATALVSAGAVNAADYEAYAYDPNGNRTSLRKRDNTTLTYSYDALNRLTLKIVPERPAPHPYPLTAAQTRDVYYGYDLRGLQTFARFDSATGEGVTNAYDGFGRPRSSTLAMDGVSRTLNHQYDRNGNRVRLGHPDGPAFATLYDGLNRPSWMGTEGVNGIASVVYLPHGAPLALNRLGASLAFDYDGVQRQVVRGFLFPAPASNVTWVHSYNAASGIANETRDNDAYAWTDSHPAGRPYATNGLNQYATTGQPNNAGSVAFIYDANGNLASEATWNGTAYVVSETYTYDVENRLVAASGTRTAALRYDPLGRLYEVAPSTGSGGSAPSGTTRFLYDGDALVAEYDAAGTMLRRHAHWPGADIPMTTYEGSGFGTVRQLFPDRQGSIAAIADHNGTRIAVNTYDEYGIPGASNTGRFQYTGQIWLAELGMYHYKARIYSPTLGRFLQTDPIGYEGGVNLYGYVQNDPVNMTDFDGKNPIALVAGCALNAVCRGAVVGGIVTVGCLLFCPSYNEDSETPSSPPPPDIPASDRRVSRNDNGGPPFQRRPGVAAPSQDRRLVEARRLESGARTKLANAREHDRRADEFLRNPTVRPGMEGRSQLEIRQQQRIRANHLRGEAAEFRGQAVQDIAKAQRLREEAGQ